MKAAIDDKTAAVLIETLQAEGGVNVPEKGYIEGVRRICDEHELILIFDEVQTGFGRTGKLFGYQHYGIEPDIMTLAKGLGSGVAIGALLAKEQIASAFVPGTHASTFGGNPLACAAALATIKTFFAENILENCVNSGAYLEKKLRELHGKYKFIKDVRGKGLIWGMELEFAVAPIINKCLEEGVLIINAGEKVLRFLPPLIVKPEHIDQMVIVLDGVLSKI